MKMKLFKGLKLLKILHTIKCYLVIALKLHTYVHKQSIWQNLDKWNQFNPDCNFYINECECQKFVRQNKWILVDYSYKIYNPTFEQLKIEIFFMIVV